MRALILSLLFVSSAVAAPIFEYDPDAPSFILKGIEEGTTNITIYMPPSFLSREAQVNLNKVYRGSDEEGGYSMQLHRMSYVDLDGFGTEKFILGYDGLNISPAYDIDDPIWRMKSAYMGYTWIGAVLAGPGLELTRLPVTFASDIPSVPEPSTVAIIMISFLIKLPLRGGAKGQFMV